MNIQEKKKQTNKHSVGLKHIFSAVDFFFFSFLCMFCVLFALKVAVNLLKKAATVAHCLVAVHFNFFLLANKTKIF